MSWNAIEGVEKFNISVLVNGSKRYVTTVNGSTSYSPVEEDTYVVTAIVGSDWRDWFDSNPITFDNAVPPPSGSDQPLILDDSEIATESTRFSTSPVFEDNFDGTALADPWFHDDMVENAEHSTDGPGRRRSGWSDRHGDRMSTVSSGLLKQIAIQDLTVSQPDRDVEYDFHLNGEKFSVNYGNSRLYAPFLTSFGRISNVDHHARASSQRFAPGHYFEIQVNFENMHALNLRHSFWLMPALMTGDSIPTTDDAISALQTVVGNNVEGGKSYPIAYDSNWANGVEVDIYEYQNHTGGADDTLSMQVPPYLNLEHTINEIPLSDLEANGFSDFGEGWDATGALITYDGSVGGRARIGEGWHTIGLYWTKSMLVWFIDGYPVVKDSVRVPKVPMYMLVTREVSAGTSGDFDPRENATGARAIPPLIPEDFGVFGESAGLEQSLRHLTTFTNVGYQSPTYVEDEVLINYIKVWKIEEDASVDQPRVLPAPDIFNAVRYSPTAGEIQWREVSGSRGYEVVINGAPDGQGVSWALSRYKDDLDPNTTYNFWVYAIDADGNRGEGARADLPPYGSESSYAAPSTPANFRASSVTNSSARLSWDAANQDPNDTSTITYRLSRDGEQIFAGTELSFTDYALTASTNYEYSVVAENGYGQRSSGSLRSVTTLEGSTVDPVPGNRAPVLPADFDFRYSVYSGNALELFWRSASDPDGDAIRYRVTDNGSEVFNNVGRSYYTGSVLPGSEHTYVISAVDSYGLASETRSVTVQLPDSSSTNRPPESVKSLRVALYGNSTVELIWEKANPADRDGDFVLYDIYQDGEFLFNKDASSHYFGTLARNTTYTFSVVSVDSKGARSAPITRSVTTN